MSVEFHRDGPWELPEGWVWARLGDVCHGPQYGWTTSAATTGRLKLLRTTDISSGKCDWSTVPACRDEPNEPEKYLLEDGDIVISRAGSVGKSFLIETPERAVFASYLVRFKPRVGPRYVYWFLQSSAYWQQITEKTAGIAIPNVNASKLRDVNIPIAPLAEQRRIVARIDELFAEIADGETALARARDDLDTWRRALLKAAVTGELTREWRENNSSNETGLDVIGRLRRAIAASVGSLARRSRRVAVQEEIDLAELPELPHGWGWSRVGEIGHVTGGLTKNVDRASATKKLPYLRVANVQYGQLDLTNVHELGVEEGELDRVLLRANDLLVVEGNGSVDQIGRCAIWAGEIDPCVHQNHIIKVRFDDSKIAHWAFHWLMSPHGRQLITKVASSTSGLHTLSISKIEALPIPISPSVELERILHILATEADDEGTIEIELGEGAKSLKLLRQAALKSAFEGRLAAQDAHDEPADRLLTRLSEQPDAEKVARHKTRARRATIAAE